MISHPRTLKGRTFGIRSVIIAAASFLVAGAIIGGTIGYLAQPDPTTTAEYKSMSEQLHQKLSDTQSELASAGVKVAGAESQVRDFHARQAALEAGEAKLKADQAALDAQIKQVQENQFSDGIHLIGTNVTPGVYSATGSNCYYVWKSGTGADADIIDNNIVTGPVTVTLVAGQTFETNRCGTWTKVG